MARGERKRIIIVEDEPIIRLDLRTSLEKAGYEVVGEGKDGIDAVSLCREHTPDVALMDINMPELDGLSAARLIRKENLCGAIVILTAYTDEGYIERAVDASVQGYLVKPVNTQSLIGTIEIACENAKRVESISRKLDATSQKLRERKTIDRAKGMLVKKEGLAEDEAYRKIQLLSMEKNCSMGMISEILLARANEDE